MNLHQNRSLDGVIRVSTIILVAGLLDATIGIVSADVGTAILGIVFLFILVCAAALLEFDWAGKRLRLGFIIVALVLLSVVFGYMRPWANAESKSAKQDEANTAAVDFEINRSLAAAKMTEPSSNGIVGESMSIRGVGELTPVGTWFVVHRQVNLDKDVDEGRFYTVTRLMSDKARGGWYSKPFGIGDRLACGTHYVVYLVVLPRTVATVLDYVTDGTSLDDLPEQAEIAHSIRVKRESCRNTNT